MPRTQEPQLEVEEQVVSDEQIFNKEDIQYFPAGRHIWRQQGPYLVCHECPLYHGVYIGMNKVMVGEGEDGKPVLQERDKVRI